MSRFALNPTLYTRIFNGTRGEQHIAVAEMDCPFILFRNRIGSYARRRGIEIKTRRDKQGGLMVRVVRFSPAHTEDGRRVPDSFDLFCRAQRRRVATIPVVVYERKVLDLNLNDRESDMLGDGMSRWMTLHETAIEVRR